MVYIKCFLRVSMHVLTTTETRAKMHLSLQVAWAAVRFNAVVLLMLLIRCLLSL